MADYSLITATQLCSQLKISRNTATKLLNANKFPNAFKVTSHWRIPQQDVDAFINKNLKNEGMTGVGTIFDHKKTKGSKEGIADLDSRSHLTGAAMDLQPYIQDVPDYPRPGVIFKDITPLLGDAAALAMAVERMVNPFRNEHVDLVVGAESRGFIFGTALAQALNAGFIPVRKPGKLPRDIHRVEYELEYGTDVLETHQDAVRPGKRVLLVDDLLATGGTMRACIDLMDKMGGEIVGITCLIELAFLHGRDRLKPHDRNIHAVMQY